MKINEILEEYGKWLRREILNSDSISAERADACIETIDTVNKLYNEEKYTAQFAMKQLNAIHGVCDVIDEDVDYFEVVYED